MVNLCISTHMVYENNRSTVCNHKQVLYTDIRFDALFSADLGCMHATN